MGWGGLGPEETGTAGVEVDMEVSGGEMDGITKGGGVKVRRGHQGAWLVGWVESGSGAQIGHGQQQVQGKLSGHDTPRTFPLYF